MSIKIVFRGGLGNCLTEYTYARLLALKNNFFLETPFPYQFVLKTTKHEKGKSYQTPKTAIVDNITEGFHGDHYFNTPLTPGKYIIHGHFQNPIHFLENENIVRSFFKLKKQKKNKKDIVLHLRLGDYYQTGLRSIIIHPDWYSKILEKESFDRVFIVGTLPDEPYLEYFKKYNPIIMAPQRNFVREFHFIRSFDKIICSNGTFSWWAAFLSDASKVYTFKKWTRNNESKPTELTRMSQNKNCIIVDGDFFDGYQPKTDYRHLPSRFKTFINKFK